MKGLKHMIVAAATVAVTSATAQNINGGFENWDSVGNEFFRNYSPTGWMDINNQNCAQEGKPWAVTRTTDARSGSYAIQLKNIALSFDNTATLTTATDAGESFNNKIPVTARHTKLEGFYKYESPGTDTFTISIIMMKGSDFIAFGEYKQTVQQTDYTRFSIPIVYFAAAGQVPDSATIMITAGSTDAFVAGSTLILDDIGFNVSQGLAGKKELQAEVSIWPNPASESINLSVKGGTSGDLNIEVVNLLGQVLTQSRIKAYGQETQTSLSLSDLPAGVLFVRVSDDNGVKGFRILHQ